MALLVLRSLRVPTDPELIARAQLPARPPIPLVPGVVRAILRTNRRLRETSARN